MLDRLRVKLKRSDVIPAHSRLRTFCQYVTCLFACDNTCVLYDERSEESQRGEGRIRLAAWNPGVVEGPPITSFGPCWERCACDIPKPLFNVTSGEIADTPVFHHLKLFQETGGSKTMSDPAWCCFLITGPHALSSLISIKWEKPSEDSWAFLFSFLCATSKGAEASVVYVISSKRHNFFSSQCGVFIRTLLDLHRSMILLKTRYKSACLFYCMLPRRFYRHLWEPTSHQAWHLV